MSAATVHCFGPVAPSPGPQTKRHRTVPGGLRRQTQSGEAIRSLAKFICDSFAALGPEFESISPHAVRLPLHADYPASANAL